MPPPRPSLYPTTEGKGFIFTSESPVQDKSLSHDHSTVSVNEICTILSNQDSQRQLEKQTIDGTGSATFIYDP